MRDIKLTDLLQATNSTTERMLALGAAFLMQIPRLFYDPD